MSANEKGAVPPAAGGVPKHRACDECRSRKLACTKEPEGCSRCRREGIACHYSPQKPMGRPRKRRQVEAAAEEGAEDDDVNAPAEDVVVRRAALGPDHASAAGRGDGAGNNPDYAAGSIGAGAMNGDDDDGGGGGGFTMPMTMPMAMPALWMQEDVSSSAFYAASDPSLAFLQQTPGSNYDFLDVLPQDYGSSAQPRFDQQHQQQQQQQPSVQNLDPEIHLPNDGGAVGQGGNDPYYAAEGSSGLSLLDGLDFSIDEPDPTAVDLSRELSSAVWTSWSKENNNLPPPPPPPVEEFVESSSHSDTSNSANSPEGLPLPLPLSLSTPSLSPPPPSSLSNSSSRTPSDPVPVPVANCGCLSSLYLALDSLSRLPPDVLGAMRVARQATKIAHDVIKCRVCSSPDGEEDGDCAKPPPIQALQNTMCLAALVPSACNAYATILGMIDREADAAAAAARRNDDDANDDANRNGTIWFSFRDVGGLWHAVGENHGHCPRVRSYNDRFLEPPQWRAVMRAILRLDVDGLGGPCGGAHAPGYSHHGLRDVVRLLDERNDRRHRRMDELSRRGGLAHARNALFPGPYRPVPYGQRNCVQILEAARMALDSLVIS
ncbi:hypothetical protein N3K66_002409 [Trichothecium roseum]|uniref:Uncharacterized protein n=1 Tax=Trichothecium roseum TaxID=47278 RepID=A0ACC0V9G5_9HYPO|nr:hypothetical protein N3K66_002409 [Trichothecium roseum]